jgi:cation-transporting ATPase E
MSDVGLIIKRNLLTPIVLAIFVLATILLFLGDGRDAWFVSVVISINTLVGIIQELRARQALKKLELMNQPQARKKLKDDQIKIVAFDELSRGNIVMLQAGDIVPADGFIQENHGLEVDESLFSGEAAPVTKGNGDIVLASTTITAGSAEMKVTAAASETKSAKLSANLKNYQPVVTPLQKNLQNLIWWLTFGALAAAVLVYIIYSLMGLPVLSIFKAITSAVVSIVPEGLLLASTLMLTYGCLRLAAARILPQKLASIEAMALLNVLCLDKTGTLTDEKISFEDIIAFSAAPLNLNELIAIVAKETGNGSSTSEAILEANKLPEKYEIRDSLAFSSARKLSGVKIKLRGNSVTILLGAPEYLSKIVTLEDKQLAKIDELNNDGKRTLLVVELKETDKLRPLPTSGGKALGLVVLRNSLRDGAKTTISFLQHSGVKIKIISGDHPQTVKAIAELAGVHNSDRIMTGDELSNLAPEDWPKRIQYTTIFARTLPEQKAKIIETCKANGLFTGMIGDGVNDAPSLKAADLGVAMSSGSSSTKRVADMILLDNSFASLPMGMKLGNHVIQSIELIAVLFFHKIIYGIVLLTITLLLGKIYPFVPRHITFMNIFLVTMPTAMWMLFAPVPKHKLLPKDFWRDTLFSVMPIAILSGLMVATTYLTLLAFYPNNARGVSTTTVLVATLLGVYLVFLAPRMFDLKNKRINHLIQLAYVLITVVIAVFALNLGLIRNFFDFSKPVWYSGWSLLVVLAVVMTIQWFVASHAGRRIKNKGNN